MKSENTSNSFPVTRAQAEALRLPYFSGFPYIWTRIVPSLYHIIVVPKLSEPQLRDIAIRQALANHLPTCLVLGDKACYYFDRTDGRENWALSFPAAATSSTARCNLASRSSQMQTSQGASASWSTTRKPRIPAATWSQRQIRDPRQTVNAFDSGGGGWTVFKGASPDVLSVRNGGGMSLPPIPGSAARLSGVYCLCENDNLCAACGKRLYERKLNAAFFNPRDRKIWNVPVSAV